MASILVIQDRDVVRALFREILERAGHFVHESAEGLKGIRRVYEWPTDLVIADIHMPDCNGLEVIATLRQVFPAIKILAVSTRAGKEDVLLVSKMLGADAIVQNSLDGEALLQAVEQLLRSR